MIIPFILQFVNTKLADYRLILINDTTSLVTHYNVIFPFTAYLRNL